MKTLLTTLIILWAGTLPGQGIPMYNFYDAEANVFVLEYEEVVAMAKVYEGYFLMENEIYSQYDLIDSLNFRIGELGTEVELRYNLENQAIKKSNEQLNEVYSKYIDLSDTYREEVDRLNGELRKAQWSLKLEKVKSWIFGGGFITAAVYILTTVL